MTHVKKHIEVVWSCKESEWGSSSRKKYLKEEDWASLDRIDEILRMREVGILKAMCKTLYGYGGNGLEI